jgi:bla regulator protein BlaR1
MILKYCSALWTAFAPALGNHLWQSTLFAIIAGLLTLILRKNHAQARYWLWLSASVKFLFPFSVLVGIGSHLALSPDSAGTKAGLYLAVEEVSQPFTQPPINMISQATPPVGSPGLSHLLPVLLTLVWLCGFVGVLCMWYVRWRRISAVVRKALPLRERREVETLRRLERIGGIHQRIEMLSSQTSLEPGIFGIVRPVLLWPEGISERLEDAHLEAILAHELWHVRRRDNLAAAIHMLVEAIFWFHPLVWWLGARLVDERERACDESVLESGSNRKTYAEGILRICEFCVSTPLACVSGVNGADLKKRIARIMTEGRARKLNFSRKLLLVAAAILAVAAPIAAGILLVTPSRTVSQAQSRTAAVPTYDTVSITASKSGGGRVTLAFGPDEFISKDASLQQVIRAAYGVEDDRISGAPAWLESEKYDVDAKENSSGIDDPHNFGFDQRVSEQKLMLQALLADRLKLAIHRETRDLTVVALVIAKNGPKLQASKPGDTYPGGFKGPDGVARPGGIRFEGNTLIGQGVPIGPVLFHLSRQLHRTVLDETGLSGTYDFALTLPDSVPLGIDNPRPPESYEPAVSMAIEQQLGLKLELKKVPLEVLVIDHVERPAESQAQNTAVAAPRFEVASVKPNKAGEPMEGFSIVGRPAVGILWKADHLMATNFTLHGLIRVAYAIQDDQISGGPGWLNSEGYDVDAKMGKSIADEIRKLSRDQGILERRRMLQALLADRFKLSLHSESKEIPIYALVIGKNGLNLQEAKPDDTYPNGIRGPAGRPIGAGTLVEPERGKTVGQGVPISDLVGDLSRELGGHIVVDKTGLKGKYDFTLQLAPDERQAAIFTALEEQLGLKLELQKAPMEVLVIDHAEKPSEN